MRAINLSTLFLIFFSLFSCQEPHEQKKPNIVYILADDLGYGDISSLNPESGIQTPNMDKLVNQGIHFTDYHTGSAVCTPTRYGILTGRYAWRTRLKSGVLWGYDPPLIEQERTTVASFLKSQGYRTACVGKWHLGLGWKAKDPDKPIGNYDWDKLFDNGEGSNVDFTKKVEGPNDLGFDYSFIIPASLDMTPYLYLENGKAVELPTNFTKGRNQNTDGRGVFWRAGEVSPGFDFYTVLQTITKKSVAFVKDQEKNQEPFFLYFPLTAPHTPWLPSEEFEGSSEAGRYGDFVAMVDHTVGQITEALEATGQLENTLLIVTSDNGAHWTPGDKEKFAHRANYIYKGQKADIYEAGHRVAYVARWPGMIPAGSSSSALVCSTDLMATLSGMLGVSLPESAGEDSFDQWKFYVNPSQLGNGRQTVVNHSLDGIFALRKGNWKYTPHLGSGGFTAPKTREPEQGEAPGTLYDLNADPGESANMYNQYPEMVKELSIILEKEKAGGI